METICLINKTVFFFISPIEVYIWIGHKLMQSSDIKIAALNSLRKCNNVRNTCGKHIIDIPSIVKYKRMLPLRDGWNGHKPATVNNNLLILKYRVSKVSIVRCFDWSGILKELLKQSSLLIVLLRIYYSLRALIAKEYM